MNKASELIDEIKNQEKKGFFKRIFDKIKDEDTEKDLRHDIYEASFHIQNAIKITGEFKALEQFDNIIISGIGTNALAGELLKAYLQDTKYDIIVVRDQKLPQFAGKRTLLFSISYTGEDHETIVAFKDAKTKGCKIIGLTSGGRLKKIFETAEKEHIVLPNDLKESYTLPYLFFPMLKILENSEMIPDQKKFIDETEKALMKPIYAEKAKELAAMAHDKIPLIYTSPRFKVVGERWKTMFNMVPKVHSFSNVFTEATHNEINGFTTHLADFHSIFLVDEGDDEFTVKSMRAVKDILKARGNTVTEIMIKGSNLMTKLFSAIYIGDWTAFELANIYISGSDVEDIITKYKSAMKN
jgi:glucose/mannose-6-phosphate isomerase